MTADIEIRPAVAHDDESIWNIFHAIVADGDTYAYAPDATREFAVHTWTAPPARAFVAVVDGRVAGTYTMRPNQPGLGNHVANVGYMVDPTMRGRGIASLMCTHSLDAARAAGFLAMQFNFVVSTNVGAVRLWERHGFAIVGRVPKAFRHSREGYVDVFVMHREL